METSSKSYWVLPGGAVLSEERMRKFIAMYAPRSKTIVDMMEQIDKVTSWCIPIRDDLHDGYG